MYISSHTGAAVPFGVGAAPIGSIGQPAVADPVAAIGAQLWARAPAGVTIGIYDGGDPELTRRGREWGAREGALGYTGRTIVPGALALGRSMADAGGFVKQVTELGKALATAVSKAPTPGAPPAGGGPSLIRTLALFTHGTNSWLGIGNGFTLGNAATVIRGIAPYLTVDFNFVVYGCSAALGQREPENWVVTTMEPGGADSLAGVLRDALIDEGKAQATVWSHTEVGHTTRNPSLRLFRAAAGKRTSGESYAGVTIFGTSEKGTAAAEIEDAVRGLGHRIPADRAAAFGAALGKLLRQHMYAAWVRATATSRVVGGKKTHVTNLTLRGGPLPELAPLYPEEVRDIVRTFWKDAYWTAARRKEVASALVRQLRLPR
jgi:hypothetical protein